jgi:hypothetical protein
MLSSFASFSGIVTLVDEMLPGPEMEYRFPEGDGRHAQKCSLIIQGR